MVSAEDVILAVRAAQIDIVDALETLIGRLPPGYVITNVQVGCSRSMPSFLP